MNLANYVKCLKKHALNRNIADEAFLNAVLKPYIDAGEIDNKNNEELYFDKSRTSLLLNRHNDIPGALRSVLDQSNLYEWTEENFKEFIDGYLRRDELESLISEVESLIREDDHIIDKEVLLSKKDSPNIFLADVLIENIKIKNDGFNPEGELIRNGAYCVNVVYKDIFKYAFRKRSKEKNIVVIPVDAEFHTHVTRKFENDPTPQVSEKSIHGQWLTRWEQSGENLSDLPDRIRESLKSIYAIAEERNKYPIGTIAVVENATTIFYLLVIAEFDENNNAHSTKEEIEQAVDALSIFYDQHGEGYELYVPLLGTGKSRSNISLQESYNILKDCYIANKSRIQGNIHIVIHKDFETQVTTD